MRDWSGGMMLLAALFKLSELTRLPYLGLLFISRVGPDGIQACVTSREPLPLYFRDYNDSELAQILLLQQPNAELYASFLRYFRAPSSMMSCQAEDFMLSSQHLSIVNTHTVSMFWKPGTKCLTIIEVNLNYANLKWCWLLSLPQCCAKDIQPGLSSGHRVVKKPRASISDLLWANSPRGGSRAWWPREAAALRSAAATHPTSPFSNSHHWGINTWYANYFPVASVKIAGAKPVIHGIHDEGDHLMLCEWHWQVLRVAGTETTVTFKLLYSFLSKPYINVFQWLIQWTASRHHCW